VIPNVGEKSGKKGGKKRSRKRPKNGDPGKRGEGEGDIRKLEETRGLGGNGQTIMKRGEFHKKNRKRER